MPDPKLLEFTVQAYAADKLEIKVKNISAKALEETLAIELYVPTYLVDSRINAAAKAAATSTKPVGVASLAGVVTGPAQWSLWARRETSDSSVVILFLNDLTQTGTELATPIKVAAGAEFIVGVPLNPQANHAAVNVLYSYLHGTDEDDQRGDGKLELKPGDTSESLPNVSLTTNATNPTAIPAAKLVKIFWKVENGVSATLRGPLPGGNTELTLSSDPTADFKIAEGFLEVRVVSGMTFILQAEVKRQGKPNVQVVRMLSLDTSNNKYTYLAPRPIRVLPYGLIEIDWAAWGVKQVEISVGGHTTRTIALTQQTLGRFYEGSGVMRVSATKEINGVKTINEGMTLEAPPETPKTGTVQVVSWIRMKKPDVQGGQIGLAVIAPRIALLTDQALHIANVGNIDSTPPLEKLTFTAKPNPSGMFMWQALTAVDQRFVCVRMLIANNTPDVEVMPFTLDGNPDQIPPVTLPPEIRPVASAQGAVLDLVGFGGRAYVAVESPKAGGTTRLAYSVGFDSSTKKANLRPEPLLQSMIGYRLVCFDDALYALNRDSGQMFRFELTTAGKLDQPKKAASAIKPGAGSMVKDGLLVPLGRLLVVMNPTSVPSVESLERFGLHNILRYTSTTSTDTDDIPQDLVYNPQKDYWARCGHDLDIKYGTVAAYRGGDSKRLWVVQPDLDVQTLAVGSETLFAHDYVLEFPTKPLPPYLNKTRQIKITNNTGIRLLPLTPNFHKAGINDTGINGPGEVTPDVLNDFRSGTTETFGFKYNDADPVPIILRFLLAQTAGVKHEYFLEVTFSGPDLATARSVFKRAVLNDRGDVTAVAEIPDTAAQHSTANAIAIAPPKRLIEGVTLRAINTTTYQLWREAPGAEQAEALNRYNGDEIKIAWNTPAFYLLGYGAGELHVDVDFALPYGVEISPGAQRQQKLIRIKTDKSTGLSPELLPNKSDTSYECKISYLLTQELDAVYIGDGVATDRGDAIYLPVARRMALVVMEVLKINPENLSVSSKSSVVQSNAGMFATPNSIALSNEFIFAMYGDTDIHVLDYSLQEQGKVNMGDVYAVITGIKCQNEKEYFLLGIKKDKTNVQNVSLHHLLSYKFITRSNSGPQKITAANIREISLDAVKGFRDQNKMAGFPAWVSSKTVSPMALSTSMQSPQGERVREVAVCIDGGLFTVGSAERMIRVLALESAGREEEIVFGREGKTIYCLHSQGENQGLRVSRVDNHAWKQTHGLTLPVGEGVADLLQDTRQRTPGTPYKNHRAISMVLSRDEKFLFVSHGRSIFQIDVAKMELRAKFKVDLPCRVFHVWFGKPTEGSHGIYGTPNSCTLLYAIGASYRGDGFQNRESKTQLYKLGIPDK
jgi:hypothetical protein